MIIKTDALILRRFPWSNTSWVLWTYTRDAGALRLVARGARRLVRRRPDKGPDLFARGTLVAFDSPRRELASLSEWDEADDHRALCRDWSRFLAAGRAGEVTLALADTRELCPLLFDALAAAFTALARYPEPLPVLFAFELAALSVMGHAPMLDRCAASGAPLSGDEPRIAFSAADGGLVKTTSARAGAVELGPEAVRALRLLTSGADPGQVSIAPAAAGRLRRALTTAVDLAAGKPLRTNMLYAARSARPRGPRHSVTFPPAGR